MAKTQEELSTLKQEYVMLTTKLKELTENELGYVVGGIEMKPIVGMDFGFLDPDSSKDSNKQK